VKALSTTLKKLAVTLSPATLIVSGGVACNAALRDAISEIANEIDVPVYFPSKDLSTDNAAMIAAAGFSHLRRGESSVPEMTADITLRLQNSGDADEKLRRRKVTYRI